MLKVNTTIIITELSNSDGCPIKEYETTVGEFIDLIKHQDHCNFLAVDVEPILDEEGETIDFTKDKFYELPVEQQFDLCLRQEEENRYIMLRYREAQETPAPTAATAARPKPTKGEPLASLELTSPTKPLKYQELLVVLPFEGFYESTHDLVIDDYLESMLNYLEEEHNATSEQIQELADMFYNEVDFKAVRTGYAERYTSELERLLEEEGDRKILLKFESLASPREYNFTTDRIFAYIQLSDIRYMKKQIDQQLLAAEVKKQFTSRDGFSSFYSGDIKDWPKDITKWDHNQLAVLVELYLAKILNTDCEDILEPLKAFNLMEPALCNGFIGDIVESNASDTWREALDKITRVKLAVDKSKDKV